MKKVYPIAAMAAALWSGFAAGQNITRLTCSGVVVYQEDAKERERKEVAVDISIDNDRPAVTIVGDWGCMLYLEKGDVRACASQIRVQVSDEAFTFSQQHRYQPEQKLLLEGATSFSLNRYSGTFRAKSVVMNHSGNGTWFMASNSTELRCKPASRLF